MKLKLLFILMVGLLFLTGCGKQCPDRECLEELAKPICEEANLTYQEFNFAPLARYETMFSVSCNVIKDFDRTKPYGETHRLYFTPEELEGCKNNGN